ncbi:MAG: glycosyl transferase family protein [Parcubacteria group bacterium Gr01-1014_29]|nr:MAG: glycosyl transferase family protein [Parcubacteria group bacterium Gr01-1014_29]
MRHSLSVVIGMYNEEENVEPVTKEIGEALSHASILYEIICASNGSTDRTEEIIKNLSAKDSRIKGVFLNEKGYGRAVIAGLAAATNDWLSIVSGDGQVDPRDIIKAYETMERRDVDIVKPRRIHRGDGWHRTVLAGIYNILLKLTFGLPGWDIDGPPKIMKREFVQKLALESRDFFIDSEIMIKAKYMKSSVAEVEVDWRTRERGTPHIGSALFKTSLQYFKNLIRWRFYYRKLVTKKIPAPPN